jgi:hypothetical protein
MKPDRRAPSARINRCAARRRTMRWYSAGEHLFCMTSSVRRAIVSQDAMIRSVIIIGSGTVLRRLRAVMDNPFPMTRTVQRFQISDVPWGRVLPFFTQ